MAKKKGEKEEKGKKGEETAPDPGVVTSQECLLEEELKKIEEKYTITRAKVNELRKKHDEVKQKTAETHEEAREFANYIEAKREKRHQQIVSIHDDQARQLKELDDEEARLQAAHEAEINRINGLIRDEEFKRIKLQDELQSMADLVLLKEQNDRKIEELKEQYARMQVEDAEMLQKMKIECLEKQREYQAYAVSTSKEEQQKLNMEAKKMVVERTTAAKRENQELRRRLTELIEEGKSLAKERTELEEHQRKIRAEVDYLKSIKKRKVPFELPKTSLSDRPPFRN
ncbi:Oidioi.mRNA.OKI2018_I69.PAR.g12726.t1.cds [Oikopleura dioica]|uniref:Oidioi.mRNA.OKI2018_I69.PAR.g12726.t1.cds n=1 Tax=Oikopleura dioica TaxID=34765 RepID=A0ABN7S600_OIKDI|nr:Oidioi.mRNA.OKI2018_I69.PAR.g12726.t1.cds [Oikopleura dioica]